MLVLRSSVSSNRKLYTPRVREVSTLSPSVGQINYRRHVIVRAGGAADTKLDMPGIMMTGVWLMPSCKRRSELYK